MNDRRPPAAPADVLAAIAAEPGISFRHLAERLGVTWHSARRSVNALGDLVVVATYPTAYGPGYRWAVYIAADLPEGRTWA